MIWQEPSQKGQA